MWKLAESTETVGDGPASPDKERINVVYKGLQAIEWMAEHQQ